MDCLEKEPRKNIPVKLEPDDDTPVKDKVEKVAQSISVLNRTRESISASVFCSESDGQLLDKALAKQLAVRKGELDSLLPRNVSVIGNSRAPLVQQE